MIDKVALFAFTHRIGQQIPDDNAGIVDDSLQHTLLSKLGEGKIALLWLQWLR